MPRFLEVRKQAILGKWMESLYASYPPETVRFLRRNKDPFGNPVGTTFSQGLSAVLDTLAADGPDEALVKPLESVLRIRSVQELAPSAALSFVFALKHIIRADVEATDVPREDFACLEKRLDRLGLMAVDSYVKLREEVFELRVREARRQVSWWLRRIPPGVPDPEGAAAEAAGEREAPSRA